MKCICRLSPSTDHARNGPFLVATHHMPQSKPFLNSPALSMACRSRSFSKENIIKHQSNELSPFSNHSSASPVQLFLGEVRYLVLRTHTHTKRRSDFITRLYRDLWLQGSNRFWEDGYLPTRQSEVRRPRCCREIHT